MTKSLGASKISIRRARKQPLSKLVGAVRVKFYKDRKGEPKAKIGFLGGSARYHIERAARGRRQNVTQKMRRFISLAGGVPPRKGRPIVMPRRRVIQPIYKKFQRDIARIVEAAVIAGAEKRGFAVGARS